jgi:hypothetical protein
VNKTDQRVVFEVPLDNGHSEMRTWFYGESEKDLGGAFYAYISRL